MIYLQLTTLLTINNPTSKQEIPKIYLPQLTLKKTTETPEKLLYLDICLQIKGGNFKLQFMIKEMLLTFI